MDRLLDKGVSRVRLALLAIILGCIGWITLDRTTVRAIQTETRQTVLNLCSPANRALHCRVLVSMVYDR